MKFNFLTKTFELINRKVWQQLLTSQMGFREIQLMGHRRTAETDAQMMPYMS